MTAMGAYKATSKSPYKATNKSPYKAASKLQLAANICRHPGCTVKPRKTKNTPANEIPVFCAKHRNAADVKKITRCYAENCDTQPRYGAPGKCPISCKSHALNGMIINPGKKCGHCDQPGIWGQTATGVRRCQTHKLPNDKNYVKGAAGTSAGAVSTTPATHNDRKIIMSSPPAIPLIIQQPAIKGQQIVCVSNIPDAVTVAVSATDAVNNRSFTRKLTSFLGGFVNMALYC
jgi:hypothetical protein